MLVTPDISYRYYVCISKRSYTKLVNKPLFSLLQQYYA